MTEALGTAALLIGGLMARLWLQARPIGLPIRATADIDLGINRRDLRITGDRKVVEPLLLRAGFNRRPGDDEFRFVKEVDGNPLVVDLLVPSGSSRQEPPEIEDGLPSMAAPGLAYAYVRGATPFTLSSSMGEFELYLPSLDAAFVLKGSLVGLRRKFHRLESDTVDAICLAAACLEDSEAIDALREHRRRKDVGNALRWLSEGVGSAGSAASRRVAGYFEAEAGVPGGAEWAAATAASLLTRVA